MDRSIKADDSIADGDQSLRFAISTKIHAAARKTHAAIATGTNSALPARIAHAIDPPPITSVTATSPSRPILISLDCRSTLFRRFVGIEGSDCQCSCQLWSSRSVIFGPPTPLAATVEHA